MKSTFSCVLYVLLVAACWAHKTSPRAMKTDKLLLQQAIKHLKPLINSEKANNISRYSPTNDIEECCSQSALECFSTEFTSIDPMNKLMQKLDRNLKKLIKMNIVNTCTPEETKNVKCESCKSYPVVSYKQFLTNLQSHLQKVFSHLP